MPNTKTVRVPHLGGIDAAYQMPHPYDSSKPTVVLVNSFTTSSELYRNQFDNKQLTDTMNLIAIELLGHGQTRTNCPTFTYWDTSIMNLQVLDALSIPNAFILGTSQGGWIAVRMALLAPDRVLGIIPLGTSLDYESERTRSLGCWNGPADLAPAIQAWTSNSSTPDFEPGPEYSDLIVTLGFGESSPDNPVRKFWHEQIGLNYQGDEGRKRIRMAAINLSERDGLHLRLSDVTCPVLWMHGTSDAVYSVENAKEEIKMLVNAKEANLEVVQGGQHFLSGSHPEEVDRALLAFVQKWAGK